MKPKFIKGRIEKKWIILSVGKRKMRIRRNSKRGIITESLLLNPKGVKEELLELAVERKEAIPTMTEAEQIALLKKWKIEKIEEIVNNQSRALSLISNGKIFIEIKKEGLRLVIPEELEEGFHILLDLVNPKNKEKRMSVRGEKLEKLNKFFEKCGIDIKGIIKDDKEIIFLGNEIRYLAQFLKSCIGFDIKHPDLF